VVGKSVKDALATGVGRKSAPTRTSSGVKSDSLDIRELPETAVSAEASASSARACCSDRSGSGTEDGSPR
jgi:hypothetical protein